MTDKLEKMHWILIAMLSWMPPAHAAGERPGELRPFTTDGCTAFADGPPSDPDLWLHCCVAHDLRYWAGGTRKERLAADVELRECVTAAGAADTAELMFTAVRWMGSPYLPTHFRWGYGWPFAHRRWHGYRALSPDERHQVDALTPSPAEGMARAREYQTSGRD